uniref:Uncharacterized protein n=1 Tax=Arundo donax TaxID=35708 RepID=A0A0A8XR90_ARUDO
MLMRASSTSVLLLHILLLKCLSSACSKPSSCVPGPFPVLFLVPSFVRMSVD